MSCAALQPKSASHPASYCAPKGDLVGELGLTDPAVADDAVLKAMVQHPVLVERPIIRTGRGTVLARPKERIHEII